METCLHVIKDAAEQLIPKTLTALFGKQRSCFIHGMSCCDTAHCFHKFHCLELFQANGPEVILSGVMWRTHEPCGLEVVVHQSLNISYIRNVVSSGEMVATAIPHGIKHLRWSLKLLKKVSLLSAHNLWFEHKDRVAAPVLIHVGVHCYRIIYATWRLVFLSLSLQDLVKSVTASCSFLKRLTLSEIRWIYSDFLKGLRDTGSFGMTSIFNKLLTALWDPIARTWTRERERDRENERDVL